MESKQVIKEDKADMTEAEQFMTVFFIFDSVLEKSELESQAALQLFKKIQSESLQ